MSKLGLLLYCFSMIAVVVSTSHGLAQTIVLDAKPAVKVESDNASTKRHLLANADQEKLRVIIVKKGERYLWASRENRELLHHLSGAFHVFIDPRGGGYIKVFDNTYLPESVREPGPRFQYMEHLTLWLGTITYWGTMGSFGSHFINS